MLTRVFLECLGFFLSDASITSKDDVEILLHGRALDLGFMVLYGIVYYVVRRT